MLSIRQLVVTWEEMWKKPFHCISYKPSASPAEADRMTWWVSHEWRCRMCISPGSSSAAHVWDILPWNKRKKATPVSRLYGQEGRNEKDWGAATVGWVGCMGAVARCLHATLWDGDVSSAVAIQVLCIWPGRGPWPGVQPHGSKAKAQHPLLCTLPVPFYCSTVVSSPLHGSNDPERDCSRAAGQLHPWTAIFELEKHPHDSACFPSTWLWKLDPTLEPSQPHILHEQFSPQPCSPSSWWPSFLWPWCRGTRLGSQTGVSPGWWQASLHDPVELGRVCLPALGLGVAASLSKATGQITGFWMMQIWARHCNCQKDQWSGYVLHRPYLIEKNVLKLGKEKNNITVTFHWKKNPFFFVCVKE